MHADIWQIHPAALSRIKALHADGRFREAKEPENAAAPKQQRSKSIAVLGLHGMLSQRYSWIMSFLGGTSTMAFGAAFDAVMSDPDVGGVLLDVDSPGGYVFGVPELAARIYSARGGKPIVAIANSQADSAAYYVATAADKLYVTPSGRVGSVGTMATAWDVSQAMEQEGVKEHLVVSSDSPYKGEWLESQPTSDAYLADLQATVDEFQSHFTADVAKHRGVSREDVRKKFGQGRDVSAKYAVEHGMADGIATFDEVLAKMSEGRMRIRRQQASRQIREFQATALDITK